VAPGNDLDGAELRNNVQAAIDTALENLGGTAGSVIVRYAPDGRLVLDPGEVVTLSMGISDADLSMAIAVGDVDKDGDVDVVIGNLGAANKLYLNDGLGNFGVGLEIGAETDFTTAIARVDVTGDGYLDVVAGLGADELDVGPREADAHPDLIVGVGRQERGEAGREGDVAPGTTGTAGAGTLVVPAAPEVVAGAPAAPGPGA